VANTPDYVPSEDDIFYRKVAQNWMVDQNWDKKLIDSILLMDTPEIWVVEWLVFRRGPKYAHKKLKRMLLE